jgi:hypothetical protein
MADDCSHACPDEDDYDDSLDCCDGNGCALCLGDEWPEREEVLQREKYGDRRAIDRDLVRRLF